MAITVVGQPTTKINAGYNPIVYYFDSTNKTEQGFRYVAVIKNDAGVVIFEKTLIPSFGDKYGVLNLNEEISSFLTYDIDFINLDGGEYDTFASYKGYDIEIGEEYFQEWEWDDFGFAGSVNWLNHGDPAFNPNGLARTMLFTSDATNEPPYTSGDTIFVNLNSGTQDKPSIQGVHKVLDVYQQSSGGVEWVVVLAIAWVGSGTSVGGFTRYSDNRKTRFNNLLSISDNYAINTALSKQDWLNWNSDDYLQEIGTSGNKFLSQIYNNYKVREDSTMFINWLNGDLLNNERPYFIVFENDEGGTSKLELTASLRCITGIDVSPTRTDWGTIITGPSPIVRPTTKSYSFQLLDINDIPLSEEITIQIDKSCVNKSTIEMLFMDKFGSFLTWNFTFRNVNSQDVKRTNYTKYLGGLEGGKFTYELKDGGNETYNADYKNRYLLRTGWLSDQEAEFFPNVIHSPVTMIKINGEFQRCTINTSSFEVKDSNWNELKRYELNVTLSNEEKINI